MKDEIFVSCIFGNKFSRLHPAIEGYRCILFSNNPALKKEANRKGWEFIYIKKFPLTSDIRESSIQSKYVKFLQFLKDYEEFRDFKKITYLDHKNIVNASQAKSIREQFKVDKNVFMISSRKGWKIRDEVTSAMKQERYRESMNETIDWIQKRVDSGRASWDGQIFATSLISYKNYESLIPLLDEVYESIVDLGQPECQVIWGVLSQGFEEKIQYIYWEDTGMVRRVPMSTYQQVRSIAIKSLKKILIPILKRSVKEDSRERPL